VINLGIRNQNQKEVKESAAVTDSEDTEGFYLSETATNVESIGRGLAAVPRKKDRKKERGFIIRHSGPE